MKNTIAIDKGEIHLWYASLDCSTRERKGYQALLSDQELERAQRLRFQDSRDKFISGRGMARQILASYTGSHPGGIRIAQRATGKPYLTDSTLQFNISHSNDSFLCAVTRENPIGIDYQVMYEISNLETLVGSFFSPREQKLFRETPQDQALHFFFDTWVRKEAFMKATGLGFHLPSQRFSVATHNGGHPRLHTDGEADITVQEWSIRDLNLQPGYKGAVAVWGEIKDIIHFHVSP